MDGGLIDRMREDYQVVSDWLRERDGWSEEDISDMGASIRRRIEAGEMDMIESWANWLAGKSREIREGKA